jgi:Flp pilus assembly protein TadG
MLVRRNGHRRAATLVEMAIVYPLVFLVTFGVIIAGMAVYTYQQVGALAREGARWASVHGGQYHQEVGGAMATNANILSAIQSKAVGLNSASLSVNASWTNSNELPVNIVNGAVVQNSVTVTVQYQWQPLLYLGSMTLSSTAVATVQY